MFTTIEEVKALTGYEVTLDTIGRAQGIIEVYVGRVEAAIKSPDDFELLKKAVAYQAAYIRDNYDTVFEQASIVQTYSSDGGITFTQDGASPWIAPLAVLACKRLSWKGIRSIKTGPTIGRAEYVSDWKYN